MAGDSGFHPDPVYTPYSQRYVDNNGYLTDAWYKFHYDNTITTQTLQGQGFTLAGTHAARLLIDPNTLPSATLYIETDRPHLVYVGGSTWTYLAGVYSIDRAHAPTDVGVKDAGMLVYVTDFGHLVRWMGTTWQWAGEQSQIIGDFNVAPTPLLWAVCDGATPTTVMTVGSGLGFQTVTPPNLAGSVLAHKYLRR